jgi:hypothetical protein
MTAHRCTQRSVKEMFQKRHDHAATAGVESAVRVAGGIPTLGGGARASRAPRAAAAASTSGSVA